MKDKPYAGTLNNWSKDVLPSGVCIVWGDLDHDERGRFFDGEHIHTSVTPNTPMKEGDTIETAYSRYTLGVPEEEL